MIDLKNPREVVMKLRISIVVTLIATLVSFSLAQTSEEGSHTTPSSSGAPEKTLGHYVMSQSVEFGYRFTDVDSQKVNPGDPTNLAMYNTLINLHTGPRLLEQTLSLRSPEHSGLLFDDLYVNSFGFGGDPNDLARIDASKYNWYDFRALFRRDWNFFDYNLLANPLNPPTSTPAIAIASSPHQFNSVRRMTDLDLTVKPNALVSLRLGYSRNTSEGPSLTTIPEASDAELIETTLLQTLRTSTDNYRIGVDFRFVPKTIISYDQLIVHTGYNTNWQDATFSWVLPNGTPADLGIAWDTLAGTPCPVPFIPAPPTASPTCSLYLAYTRSNPFRTSTPTEAVSISSSLIPRVSITGRVSYSNTNMSGQFFDFFNGFFSDQSVRQYANTGPLNGNRINVSTDLAATVQVTRHFRIIDQFRFYNFRIPSFWNSTLQTWTGGSAFDPVGPTPGSVDNTLFSRFLGENTKSNETRLAYDFTPYFGATLGYRYRTTVYTHTGINNDLTTGNIDTDLDVVDVHANTGIVGLWVRDSEKLRANLDAEVTSADNFLTRTSPLHSYLYRARVRYRPVRWLTLAATGDNYEARNGIQEISYNAHDRNFGFTASATRGDRLGFEMAYNFNDVASNAFLCFQDLSSTLPPGTGTCTADTGGGAPFELYQTYSSQDNYGSAQFLAKPMKRLTAKIGYSIVSVNGNATFLNPLQPFGSLKSNYHRPIGEIDYEFAHAWTGIVRWNYYEYLEKTPFFGPTAPRSFHANLTTVSLRYAF
jgi:hypothetical protein